MYNRFNKTQAKYIIKTHSDLIGQPFDKELSITHILVIPVDQDSERILREYIHDSATSDEIAEKYGNEENLNVVAYSFDLIKVHILPPQDISAYLNKDQLDEITNIEE